VRVRRKTVAALAVTIAAVVAATGLVGAGSAAPQQKPILVSLISDIGRFNDKSFNQFQLEGLQRAKKVLGVRILPLQSNSDADYSPNLTTAVRRGANLIICAGFLLANDCAKFAARFKDRQFAITDYSVYTAPFANKKGKPLYKNMTGLTYDANESGCLVGHLAALMTKRAGGKQVIGAVGGLKIPPVDIWIAGYRFCAKKANPKIQVLIGYSQDFVASDKCKAVAESQIAQGAQVLFQVAGGCGLGVLKAADEAGAWGIGVDKDQIKDAKRVLTSGLKRVDEGVFQSARAVAGGAPFGGGDINFDLSNNGMGVGTINKAVPKAFIASMEKLRKQIADGKLKVPSSL